MGNITSWQDRIQPAGTTKICNVKFKNSDTQHKLNRVLSLITTALAVKPGNSAEVDAMQRIQDKLQSFFSIVAEYQPYQVNNNSATLAQNMLNRYKNAQFGKNFDKSIKVQYETILYWQKVVCKPIYVQNLYIGFISAANKSITYHEDVKDPTYLDKFGPDKENNIMWSEKLYGLVMDHLFENLRAEFAKYGILPNDALKFGLDPEFLYLLFNTCTKLIDGKPLNVRNTDNIQIDPTSDDYKNKIVIQSQIGNPVPDFIQDLQINPLYVEGQDPDYDAIGKSSNIYFENKETLVNACKLFLFLYRKKTCTKYMKKTQTLDKEQYRILNMNAPQEISFIESWAKRSSSGGQISKEAYNEMLGRLMNRSSFKTLDINRVGVAGVSVKSALNNTLISLNIAIPENPPDNQTYRLCKISGMPPMIGSPEMLAAARKAKLTADIGEDSEITDADRLLRAKADDDAITRNNAAIAAGASESFTNIPPKLIEGMGSTNQIENLFANITRDVKLFIGYIIVMILVGVLCFILMSVAPAAFGFTSNAFIFTVKNVGDIGTMLFTGLGLSLTGMMEILQMIVIAMTNMVSMIINVCVSVFKDLFIAIYSMISIALSSVATIIGAAFTYITQQVLNFAQLTFGTTGWLGSTGFSVIYQQTLSFIEMMSNTSYKSIVFIKDQIANFLQVSGGTGISIFDIIYKLILLFFTIIFTVLSTLVTFLLSSIAFILNFFLGTTTNIVQTLYNYSSEQVDLFVKMTFGTGASLFKIIYEFIMLIGKLLFASIYTCIEVLLSIITALMRLILGTSGGVFDMLLNFFTLISTLLKNIGSGIFYVIYDSLSFLGKTIGSLPSMSFNYIINLFSNVFSKYNNTANPAE